MKEKGDPCIFMGYATQLKGYRVYNKRKRLIVETIHINFDELKEVMMADQNSSGLAPQRQMALEQNNHNNEPSSSTLVPDVAPSANISDPSLQELELLFSPMYEEYFNGGNHGVSKSSVIFDLQQQDASPTLNVQPTLEPSTLTTNFNAEDNINNPEMCMFALIMSKDEPKNINEAMADHVWIKAMQEELYQFDILAIWELIDKPFGKSTIGLKWL
ncbi:gag-pol polyprotein [Tanacetum coccineum]|uniref:Gag-pol polyprotein n=1 Tax=Tanacetum coccineum TaxID=301880 RepID=A0ABQ5FT31_9ASTR